MTWRWLISRDTLMTCLTSFSTVKFLFFPFHTLFFGGISLSLVHSQGREEWKLSSVSWRGIYTYYLGFCYEEDLFFFLHCLIIQSFTSAWIHVYFFYTLSSKKCYLFCGSNCSHFGYGELFNVGSCVPLTCLLPFLVFGYFTFQHCSSCIFTAPTLESAISPRCPGSKWYLET